MLSKLTYRCPALILMLIVIAGPACRHKRKLPVKQEAVAVAEDSLTGKCKLEHKTAKQLSRLLAENELQYEWMSAKAEVESLFGDKEESFDIRYNLRKDSALLVSIQYVLGLNVAKVLITRDTVKFVDYIHKSYFIGDFAYISEMLNADLDFDLLQSVLLGNSAEFYDDDAKLKSITDRQSCFYLLSTERKKRLQKIMNGSQAPNDDLQTLSLSPENYRIIKNEFMQPSTGITFLAQYSAFQDKDSVYAPHRVDIDIQAQKTARLKINYVRMEKNKPQRLNINIPAKYDAIQFQKK